MRTIYITFLTLGLMLLQACDDTTFQPKGDYISGYAWFVDTNIVPGGYYEIALYQNQNEPFSCLPTNTEVMDIRSLSSCYYRIHCSGSGTYYVAVIWVENTKELTNPIVLGVLGCDTTHNCVHPNPIEFPNFTGADYNIYCWADTSKRLN